MNSSPATDASPREDVLAAAGGRLAQEIPDTWLLAPDGQVPQDPALQAQLHSEGGTAIQALFTPIDPETEERLIDQHIARYVTHPIPAAANPVAVPRARPRRWWLPAVPLAAAAAGLVILLRTGGLPGLEGPQTPDLGTKMSPFLALPGEVRATSTARGPDAGSPQPLTVRQGRDWFYLDCHTKVRASFLAVEATREDQPGPQVPVTLRADVMSEAPSTGARLHVHAEIQSGRWAVTCRMFDEDARQVVNLSPPAPLVVR